MVVAALALAGCRTGRGNPIALAQPGDYQAADKQGSNPNLYGQRPPPAGDARLAGEAGRGESCVRGTVTSDSVLPTALRQAAVTVELDGVVLAELETDSRGAFHWCGVEQALRARRRETATVTVQASREGFQSASRRLVLSDSQPPLETSFQLRPAP